jgi:hypothetical protein
MRNSKGNERLGSEGALSAGLELGQIAEVISGGGRGDESGVKELEDSISNVGKIGLDLGPWICS